MSNCGSVQFWIPVGTSSIPKFELTRLHARAQVAANWNRLFGGLQCKMSPRFQRTLSQHILHNMRGSDEAATMIIAGVIKGLAEELKLPLSSQALSYGCPSRRTLARGDARIAADVLLLIVRDIKREKVQWISIMTDHGKRSGVEHFIKIILFAARDKHGRRIIKRFCLDVDKSSHAALNCAAAIKESLSKLNMAGLDLSSISIISITGDSGGGGAVQHIHPPLIDNGVMTKKSKKINCQFHAHNKGFENACTKTFGKHGIGQCNAFQTAYVYVKMIKTLHETGGNELIDTVHSLVVEKLVSSVEWQEEASVHSLPFDEVWNRLMAEPNDETLEDVTNLSTMHERNIQMPNFGRWMSIFPSMFLLRDNWVLNYFIAVAIKQTQKPNSCLSQYASTLLGLMNVGSGPPGTQLKKGECSPIYAECLFICGFGEANFIDHFKWLERSDPEFGPDSFGQSIRLYVERVYDMWKDMNDLVENDGWKSRPEFRPYVNAIEKVPDLGNKQYADKSFFVEAPQNFFREIQKSFAKHTSTACRSSEILIYMVGGNPTLARMLLQWLKFAEMDEAPMESHVFESKTITLKHQGS